MHFDKLTLKAQEAVIEAERLAGEFLNPQIEPEHLLRALLVQSEGIILPVLNKLGVSQGSLFEAVEQSLSKLPKVQGTTGRPISPNLNRVLENALKQADRLKDDYVSTEHLLLALAEIKDTAAQEILATQGITTEKVLKVLVGRTWSSACDRPEPRE